MRRAKLVREMMNENYPMGARHDPDAPYNQTNNDEVEVRLENNEIVILYVDRSGEVLDRQSLDPANLDNLAIDKLDLAPNTFYEIEYIDVQQGSYEGEYIIETNYGEFSADLQELVELDSI